MSEWPVELPNLPTQRAIAEVLGALDDKIAANQRLAVTTAELLSAEFTRLGSTEFLVLRSKGALSPPMSFLLVIDEAFRAHAIQHLVGSSGRQRVSAGDVESFELRFPLGSPEVDRLSARAVALFERVKAATVESRHLATLRDTLLPHLTSGRITVRDAGQQVETVL